MMMMQKVGRQMQFRDSSGKALPSDVNRAAGAYVSAAFGDEQRPTQKDASLLKSYMSSSGRTRGKVAPRQAKKLRRDAE